MKYLAGKRLFAEGTSVKLTDRYAMTLMRRPKNKTNWIARRGVVLSCNAIYVYVTWAGNRTCETLPVAAVEEVVKLASGGML